MTIQPSFFLSRNIIAAKTGEQPIDASFCFASAATLFYELNEKSHHLKHALGLLQNVEDASIQNCQLPTHLGQLDADFPFSSDVIIDPQNPRELSSEAQTILNNPNLASAKEYVKGLETAFNNWTPSFSCGEEPTPSAEETAIFNKYNTQFQTLKNQVNSGSVTNDQYTQLYALPQQFVQEIESLDPEVAPPKSQIVNFWQQVMAAYTSVVSISQPVIESLNEENARLSIEIDRATEVMSIMRRLVSSIKDLMNPIWNITNQQVLTWDGAKYNAMQLDMIQTLMTISGLYRSLMQYYPQSQADALPPEIQEKITEFINSMKDLKANNTVKFNNLLSLVYSYFTCAQVFAQTTLTSATQYQNALNQEKQFWNSRETPNFLIQNGPLEQFAANIMTPYQNIDLVLMTTGSSKILMNPQFFQSCIDLMTSKPAEVMTMGELQKVIDAMNTSVNAMQTQVETWRNQIVQNTAKRTQVDPSQLNYFAVMNQNKQTFVQTASLQKVYASLMLDKYLPNQQVILETLGTQMTYSNKAAKFLNDVIAKVTNFNNADVYYSLNIYLRQMNLQALPDSLGKAISVLEKEKMRCQTDVTRCLQAKQEIQTILTAIEADSELLTSQKQDLRLKLKNFDWQFDSLITSLGNLKVFLEEMTLTPVSKPEEVEQAFDVKINGTAVEGWIKELATLESFVIEGGNNMAGLGGAQQLLRSLESTQQDFTTFNQNQQLALQLESTAIQQEWTIISAGLTLMNQVFAKLIQKIKR